MLEKRSFYRSATTFPVELKNDNFTTGSLSTRTIGNTVNISEGGLSLVSSEDLESLIELYLNLPPCYSDDQKKAKGIEAKVKIAWSRAMPINGKFQYGFIFTKIKRKKRNILKDIINYEIEKAKQEKILTAHPKINIHREIHSCNMYAIDLTIGCESGCRYCHFCTYRENEFLKKYPFCKDFPIQVDISSIYQMKDLPETVVYLSPSSDAFAPKARELTHELLEYMLPKGVIFTISTKHIIPDKTIALLKKYHHLIEGIAITITNLSDARNNLIEPGCPSARERLLHMQRLKEIGCFIAGRMDPLFPLIDDTEENLHATIKEIVRAGAGHITGTYLFTFGKSLRELRRIPQLKESMMLIKEKTYPIGGVAFSVSIEQKKKTYEKMNEICKSYGIKFNTCGCKDIVLRETEYPLVCRNIDYYGGTI